ncbi:MAG: hypothetical protein KBD19_00040 [Candidatus Moranbacteria bacterium]|nr:hypothetical protein [Candidatus Moranbacteria bacterium]
MNLFLKHGILLFSAVLLAVSTVLVPIVLVHDKESARVVWYGFPFQFIAQDFSGIAEKSFFPRYIDFFENWENIRIADYSVWNFIFSLFIFAVLLESTILFLEWLKRVVKG